MEPEVLRRGKAFHRLVQSDWAGEIENTAVRLEHSIRFRATLNRSGHHRRGRLDIFIERMDDFVTIVEIKATDWNLVLSKNRRKLLGAHRRQILHYVDKYLDDDHVAVCAGVIYPKAPTSLAVKAEVEDYLNGHALQVVWYA